MKTHVISFIFYFILHFSVNADTGVITLQEKVPEMAFVIVVKVRDQRRPPTEAFTTITIKVVYITDDAVYNSGSIRING